MKNKRTVKRLKDYLTIMQGVLLKFKPTLGADYKLDKEFFMFPQEWLNLSDFEVEWLNAIFKDLMERAKDLIFWYKYAESDYQELMLRIFELNKLEYIMKYFWNEEEKQDFEFYNNKIETLFFKKTK